MEHKKRKSGGSHKESRDIMPCTYNLNWNTNDQETDIEEGGSDVMELKDVRPDKMLFEKTTHDTGPAYSEVMEKMKSCEQINIEAVNKMTTKDNQQTKVFVQNKTLGEKITNEAGLAYLNEISRNKFGQQTKGRTVNNKKTNAGNETKGKENNEAIRTRSQDIEKNESIEYEQDDIQKKRSDTKNKKTKHSQYEQSYRSKCEAGRTHCEKIYGQTAIFSEQVYWKLRKCFSFLKSQEVAFFLQKRDESTHNDKSRNYKKIVPSISVLRKYVCLLLVLVLIVCDVNSYESTQNAKWQLNNTHVVFGESVALKFSFGRNMCKNDSTRRWSKYKYQDFLITNGRSRYPDKYREVLSPDCYTSYLIINNFNKDDMDVEYTFAYSAKEFSSELKLEKSMYTSFPKNETITSDLQCTNNNLSLILKLVDINPVPNCSMVIINDTISSDGNSHNFSYPLSSSEYRFQYQLMNYYMKGRITVSCDFGTKRVTVFDEFFNCEDRQNLEKENAYIIVIAVSIAVIVVISIVVIIIVICQRKGKCKKEKHHEESTDGNDLTEKNQNGDGQNGKADLKEKNGKIYNSVLKDEPDSTMIPNGDRQNGKADLKKENGSM